MEKLVDCFYRISSDIASPDYPHQRIEGETFVALEDVIRDPDSLVSYYEAYARSAAPFFDLHCFFCAFFVRGIAPDANRDWHLLDPRTSGQGTWRTLNDVLVLADLRLFGGARRSAFAHYDRFDYAWEVEREKADALLRVRRRKAVAPTPPQETLFNMLVREGRRPVAAIPRKLLDRAALELEPVLQEEVGEYPLAELAAQAKRCLETATCFHHFLCGRMIDRLLGILGARIIDTSFGYLPYQTLTWFLTNYEVLDISRDQLLDEIRHRYPAFEFHPRSVTSDLTRPDVEARIASLEPSREAPPTPAQRQMPAWQTGSGIAHFHPVELPDDLAQWLDFIDCQLSFARYTFEENQVTDLQACALFLVQNIEELRGTWSGEPTIQEVDPDSFWRIKIWKCDDTGRSTSHDDAFRYALYDPPYWGLSQLEQELVEEDLFKHIFGDLPRAADYAIFAVETQGSAFFINEWWDYCWVLFRRSRPEAIVIFGTATD
jgi:hypothetical protein